MRATITPAFFLCISVLFAQTDSTAPLHRNEVGIDVTAFLRQFLWSGSSELNSGYYLPTYQFTYRYHLGSASLRGAVGAYYIDEERPAYWYNSAEETYRQKSSELYVRVGIEWHQELHKRWQVFYGVDIKPSWSRSSDKWDYSNAGYRHGHESKEDVLAIGPVVGLRYRITPRFSLSTESGFSFMKNHSVSREFSEPLINDADHPPIPDETISLTSYRTLYQIPLSVIATFDL